MFNKWRINRRTRLLQQAIKSLPSTWELKADIHTLMCKDIDGNLILIVIYDSPKPVVMVRDSMSGFLLAQHLMTVTAVLGTCIPLGAIIPVEESIAPVEASKNEQDLH